MDVNAIDDRVRQLAFFDQVTLNKKLRFKKGIRKFPFLSTRLY